MRTNTDANHNIDTILYMDTNVDTIVDTFRF